MKEHYEKLIDSISKELEFYKVTSSYPINLNAFDHSFKKKYFQTEHTILRKEIHAITTLNTAPTECIEDFTKYKNVSEAVVENLNKQIQQLTQVGNYTICSDLLNRFASLP